MEMEQILVAVAGCATIFGASHCFWRWRVRRKSHLAAPIFGERLFLALGFYFAVSYITGWGDQFALAMLISYLVLLIGYTWYAYRKYYQTHPQSGEKKS